MVVSWHSVRVFEIGDYRREKPARLAAGDAAMIETQGERYAAMHHDGAGSRDGLVAHFAGTQNGDRRRYHQRDSVASGEGTEIRQHQGEAAEVLRRERALMGGRLGFGDGGAQSPRGHLLNVAYH